MTVCRLMSDHTLSASVGALYVPCSVYGAIVCVGVLLHAVQKVTDRRKVAGQGD